MLSISLIKSVSHALTYYNKNDNYYTKEGSSLYSIWSGKGAEILGLHGEVGNDVFSRVLKGLIVDGLEPVVKIKEISKDKTNVLKTQLSKDLSDSFCSPETILGILNIYNDLSSGYQKKESTKISVYEKKMIHFINQEKNGSLADKMELKKKIQSSLKIFKNASRRVAYDLTFSAPKSVSLVAMVYGDDRLMAAHRASVLCALGVMEKEYALVRDKDSQGMFPVRKSGNILSALFEHDISRKVDPQLHTHCVVMNLTHDKEKSWRALFPDGFFYNSKKIGVVYQNELAFRVQELGYVIEPHENGTFDIKGYSQDQLKGFSKRTVQLEKLGAKTQKQKTAKINLNRDKKTEISRTQMKDLWLQTASELEITHPIAHLAGTLKKAQLDLNEIAKNSISDLSAHDVSFSREQLQIKVLSKSLGSYSYEQVCQIVDSTLNTQTQSVWSMKKTDYIPNEILEKEKAFIQIMKNGQNSVRPILDQIEAKNFVQSQKELQVWQKEAVVLFLNSTDRIMAWQGVAGAGKSRALRSAAVKAQEAGFLVRGFAVASQAAQVLGQEAKLSEAASVASLLLEKEVGPGSRQKEIWIVDEAGLVGVSDMHDLLLKAQKEGARVIFVGDTRQLSSVSAGNPFKQLQRHGIQTAYLDHSQRQKDPILKNAVDLIAMQKVIEGAKVLDQGQKIIEIGSSDKINQHMAHTYLGFDKNEVSKHLFIATTNEDKDSITHLIRSGLKDKNELKNSYSINVLVSKNVTLQALQYANAYKVGDIVCFHRKQKGFETQKSYIVVDVNSIKNSVLLSNGKDKKELALKNVFCTLYENKSFDVCDGEKLRWTRNHVNEFEYEKNSHINSKQFSIVSIDKDNQIALILNEQGLEEKLDLKKSHFIDYDYVSTVFSSQGKTCENVYANLSRIDKENFYVAVSRAKYDCNIFVKSKDLFFKKIEISGAKLSAEEKLKQDKKNFQNKIEKPIDVLDHAAPTVHHPSQAAIDLTSRYDFLVDEFDKSLIFEKKIASIGEDEKRAVRTVDPSCYLKSRGFVVKKDGIHMSVCYKGDEVYRVTHKDGTYISCDKYGNEIGDNISLVQDVEHGMSFVDAIKCLQTHSLLGSYVPGPDFKILVRHDPPVLPVQNDVDVDQGRHYLLDRGIDEDIIKIAEKNGIVRYTDQGILFVGYDANGVVKNVTRQAIDPNHPIQRQDFKGSDKQYSQILKGNPETIWIVEGGSDALALQSMAHRDHIMPPTVIMSGGSNVQSFLENGEIQDILKKASKVTVAFENEKDTHTQAKTDSEHNKQIQRVKQITTAEIVSWKPDLSQGKDLADVNFKKQEIAINQRKQRVIAIEMEQKLGMDGPTMSM